MTQIVRSIISLTLVVAIAIQPSMLAMAQGATGQVESVPACPSGQKRIGNDCVVVITDVLVGDLKQCQAGQRRAKDFTCVTEVFFHGATNLSMNEARARSSQSGWALANADDVQMAWKKLGLNRFAFGMLADGRFAVPLQKARYPFERGANIGVNSVNQGFFYVLAKGDRAPANPNEFECLEPTGRLVTCVKGNPVSAADRDISAAPPPPVASVHQVWDAANQHPAQVLFGLGDAVLMREAATLQLQRREERVTADAVEKVLGGLLMDAMARYQFAPFLLQVTFEALAAPNADAGQKAFRGVFEEYMSQTRYRINSITYDEWREFNGEGPFRPAPTQTYGVSAANLLPKIPDASGFLSSLHNPMYIGDRGSEAIRLLIEPALAASLPEFKNSDFGRLGADLQAVAAGVGIGATAGMSAASLALVSVALFGYKVVLGVAPEIVLKTQWIGGVLMEVPTTVYGEASMVTVTPASLVSQFGGRVSVASDLGLASGAAIGVGISLALATMVGWAFGELAKADKLDRRLRQTLDAGPQPVDAYALVNKKTKSRSLVFSYLFKMLIADPADAGVLTLALPCAPGEIKSDAKLCVREVKFHAQVSTTLQQAKDLAAQNQWKLARPDEVANAWAHLKLDVYAFGMMSDGRFAVPVQSDRSNFKAGHNLFVQGGNQGFFYTEVK